MEINRKLQAAKYGYIVLSLLICIFGILLIVLPGIPTELLCRIGGSLLIVFGCIKILGYLSKDLYRLAFQFDLAFGLLLIALGILLLIRTEAMVPIVCILLGIFILTDSLLKIQTAIDARTFGIRQWWMILTAAAVTAVLGMLILFRHPETQTVGMILLGSSFLGEGILNLTTVLTAVRILRKKPRSEKNTDAKNEVRKE